MVLYIADTNVNAPWTQTCISQADCILLVGLAEGSPSIGEYERFLLGMKTTARKELVLLHAEAILSARGNEAVVEERMWINGGPPPHANGFSTNGRANPSTNNEIWDCTQTEGTGDSSGDPEVIRPRRIRHNLSIRLKPHSRAISIGWREDCVESRSDCSWWRWSTWNFPSRCHQGFRRSWHTDRIVGGTSIGAFIGALYARDADVVPMYGRAKKFAGRMGSMWRLALDLTYPSVSYTTGHEFNRGIFKTFWGQPNRGFLARVFTVIQPISASRVRRSTLPGYVCALTCEHSMASQGSLLPRSLLR